jgi:hypothetical protein
MAVRLRFLALTLGKALPRMGMAIRVAWLVGLSGEIETAGFRRDLI